MQPSWGGAETAGGWRGNFIFIRGFWSIFSAGGGGRIEVAICNRAGELDHTARSPTSTTQQQQSTINKYYLTNLGRSSVWFLKIRWFLNPGPYSSSVRSSGGIRPECDTEAAAVMATVTATVTATSTATRGQCRWRQNNGSNNDSDNGDEPTTAATAGAAVAGMTTLTVADDDGGRLRKRKRKGEGVGPTWLLSIINERASGNVQRM